VLCGVGAYALQSKAGLLAGETLPQGIIVLGVFIILISFLGCLAAFKESRCFLGIVREEDTARRLGSDGLAAAQSCAIDC